VTRDRHVTVVVQFHKTVEDIVILMLGLHNTRLVSF